MKRNNYNDRYYRILSSDSILQLTHVTFLEKDKVLELNFRNMFFYHEISAKNVYLKVH